MKTNYFINKNKNNHNIAKKTAYKVQEFNNFVIDEYVASVDNNNPVKPSTAMLWADLTVLMKPTVYANYQKIINSKYTSDTALHKMLVRNKAEKDLNRIVESQVERVAKNVDFVEKTLQNYETPLKQYNNMLDAQRNRSVANRKKILEDIAVARNEINATEGLNIPSDFSYRDLDVLTEQQVMQSQSISDWEEAVAMNEEAESNGKQKPFTQKRWIHTHNGATTRHQEMGNYPVIGFDDLFQVEDENTGTVDSMLYPRDLQGSPENVYGCVCEIEYF